MNIQKYPLPKGRMGFAFIFTLTLLAISPVLACTCPKPTEEDIFNSYGRADYVIEARVDLISDGWESMAPQVRLEILQQFKGDDLPHMIRADYNKNEVACGLSFETDQIIILGAYRMDIKTLNPEYGYRLMNSCEQSNIKTFLEQQNETIESE